MKTLLYLFVFILGGISLHAQGYKLKELLSLKDHDVDFFHDYVTKKGYSYERSKYDEKRETYSWVFLGDIAENLHEINYVMKDDGATVTFGTTDVKDYEQIKKDIDLLQFKFVRFVPKQQHGRSVLMIVYTDGYTIVNVYNSYIEDGHHELVRFYRVKVY